MNKRFEKEARMTHLKDYLCSRARKKKEKTREKNEKWKLLGDSNLTSDMPDYKPRPE